jgi:hypothetical protein
MPIDPRAPHPERAALAPLTRDELTRRLAVGVENFDARLLKLTDAELDTAFLSDAGVGRWPCRVLVGHMADADVVWIHRLRRAVGEDNPVFALWDENAFIDANIYGDATTGPRHPVGAFVAMVHTTRKWTSEWLGTLTDAQWQRQGLHPERGGISVRTMVELTTWHLEHHAWYLNRKIEKMRGPG